MRQPLALVCVCLCVASLVQCQTFQPILLVHGGAGNVANEKLPLIREGMKLAARIGFEKLKETGSPLDAVQEAVNALELDTTFNAGHGSVLTWDETVEMDAAIMDGSDLSGGCVSLVRDIYHPVTLARRVMEKTRHRYLAGAGAMAFAQEEGFELLPEGALVTEAARTALQNYKNSLQNTTTKEVSDDVLFGPPGTVGAVAIDAYGNLAAATSTGGVTGKLSGRIGDSPILGGGTYADNDVGAISATGHGETIMRYNLGSRILALMHYEGLTAQMASEKVLADMLARFDVPAGVISIDAKGRVGVAFTSARMGWAFQRDEELHFGVDKGEHQVEIVGEPRHDFY